MAAFLTRPSVDYRDSYLQSIRETQITRPSAAWEQAALSADFAGFVRDLLERGDPAQAVPGRMPEMIYWLIDDAEYVGRVSIRHAVNDWVRTIGGAVMKDGRVQEIMNVPLKRPRPDLGLVRGMPEFAETRYKVWRALHDGTMVH